jgi:hypothetical protein
MASYRCDKCKAASGALCQQLAAPAVLNSCADHFCQKIWVLAAVLPVLLLLRLHPHIPQLHVALGAASGLQGWACLQTFCGCLLLQREAAPAALRHIS